MKLTFALFALAACTPAPAPRATTAPASAPPPTAAQAKAAAAADELGAITFEVTTGSHVARGAFLRGVLAMHSFWYDQAIEEFQAAVAADPGFAMGHWGLAMANIKLLFLEDDVEAGRAALARIAGVDGLSERERGWIEASRALFTDGSAVERRVAFAAAMATLHTAYPDDDEIATFHSLALMSSLPPGDPDEPRVGAAAGAIALEVMARNPRHPGAAHYVIHAFDTPALAPVALPAARIYARIAPAAYHARHMPAHIFGRLGMWDEAFASCQSAWDASVAAAEAHGRGFEARDYHSLSWLVELAFERGQRRVAEAALAQARADVEASNSPVVRGWYSEMVATYMENTEDWQRLDELLAPLARPAGAASAPAAAHVCAPSTAAAPPPDGGPPFAVMERMKVAELRLAAAVERRDRKAAARHSRELDDSIRAMRPFRLKLMGAKGVADEDARMRPFLVLGRKVREARLRRDARAMLPLVQRNAVLADGMPSFEPPVLGASAREAVATTLMELGRPAEALVELERVLKDHPNRARVMLAALRAARAAKDDAAAERHRAALRVVWAAAEPDFPGLTEIR
jgi:tetratricopeptide (TPR) repeat protein